jgi:16S rRNA (cytidine1402-2'-O)-methyltransferase
MTAKTLLLVPSPLSQETPRIDLSEADLSMVRSSRHWLVETPKVARAVLKLYGHPIPIAELDIRSLSDFKHKSEIKTYFGSLDASASVGVLSDAGCPGIADPGAQAAAVAHEMGLAVKPMVGASSVFLALMASGMSGQSFAFHGYLPVDEHNRADFIKRSETLSAELSQTQIAIETPYRNQVLFNALSKTLKPSTLLCIATEITGIGESIATRRIDDWKKSSIEIGKRATLFLWQAEAGPKQKTDALKKR